MNFLGLLLGTLVGIIALYVWYKLHRSVTRGESFELLPSRRAEKQNESLEEFIATYRRSEVSPNGTEVTSPAAAASLAATTLPVGQSAAATPVKRDPFLSGAAKLAYYVCKTGLKDHHVFAHVPLTQLSTADTNDATPVRGSVDLLICNAGLFAVAAIDVIGPDSGPADSQKTDYLRSLGIRYLRVSPKSLPKPEDIRTLIYRL